MQVAVVERVSTAAKGLCMWLHAMNVYHKVAKEVGPKRAKVAELTAQLEAANAELQEKRDNLAAVVAKVEQLQKTCDETVAEKHVYTFRKHVCASRIPKSQNSYYNSYFDFPSFFLFFPSCF